MHSVILGTQYGDEGKGKVIMHYINNYDICVRFNGGPNAGHTIYLKGKKFVTHQIPSGIFNPDIICVIGPGCVIDLDKLNEEITGLESKGITWIRSNLKIAFNAHVIQSIHIEKDKLNDPVGSTGCGIRYVYSDKHLREGTRIESLTDMNNTILGCEVVDTSKLLNHTDKKILFEGAQGCMLDINWGNYPYVTSSDCNIGAVTTTGVSFKKISKVYGVAKIYNTYVGKFKFQDMDDENLKQLGILGKEFGSTTGRARQCNWLNLDELTQVIMMNGIDCLIFNKCDIIQQLGVYRLIHYKRLHEFNSFEAMKIYIDGVLKIPELVSEIIYSYSPERI